MWSARSAARPCPYRRYEESRGTCPGETRREFAPTPSDWSTCSHGGRNRDNRTCRRRTRGLGAGLQERLHRYMPGPGDPHISKRGRGGTGGAARRGPSQGLNSVFEFRLVGGRALTLTAEAFSPLRGSPEDCRRTGAEGAGPSRRGVLSSAYRAFRRALRRVGLCSDGPFERSRLPAVPGSLAMVFRDEERQALAPWDGEPYQITHWRTAKVHPDHHVACQYALYSVPTDLCAPGQQVEIGPGQQAGAHLPPGKAGQAPSPSAQG